MVKRTLTLALLASGLSWAEPNGPQVIHGGVNIQNIGPTTLINQSTDRAIINWNGFSIDVHELVRFVQPNQLSVILNRVVGTDPSNILGQMQANGRVFLINPNGVVFGPSAKVDVGGLMATTLNLTDQDFLAGRYHLTQDADKPLASVINQGELKVAEGGFLLLVAPMVDNQGVILAKAGQVGLVGSREATINFDGQGLVEITLPNAQISNPGTVALAPQAVSEVLRQVVADPQIVEAGQLPRGEGLVVQEGRIEGGRVLLHSTQATLAAPGSTTSGQDVRILSNGLARLDGKVEADFAELSGRHFGLTGTVIANQFLLDPDVIHITDSNANAPLDVYLPNVLLANDASPNEISRGALEALPAGTQVVLEAQHLIQVDDMAGDEINLAPSVSVHMTVFDGDIRFVDSRDRLNTSAGGSYRFDAPNGTVAVGDLRTPGGSVTINAGLDATFDTISTFDVLGSLPPGNVDIRAGRDIFLGGIGAGNTRLEAGGSILNAVQDGGSVQGLEASFNAGGRVGTPEDPVYIGLDRISGLATEYNFRYEDPPTEALVNGIDGLNLRVAPPQPPAPTVSGPFPLPQPPRPPLLDTSGVNQVPIFQINEKTSDSYQPVPVVPAPSEPGTGSGDVDQALLDSLAFVSGLPGYQITSQSRVSDLYSMHVESDDLLPLFEALGQRGWKARMTGERLQASKDGLVILGSLTPTGADLQVSPDPIPQAQWIDFTQFFRQLENGKPVEIQVDQYRLSALLDALGQHGWRARMTADRLDGEREGHKLTGVIEGSSAVLQVDGNRDPFAFLAMEGLQRTVQVADSQKFIYQLGSRGLMPWIEAFAARGYRVRATDEHFEAWKGDEKAEGIVSGQRFFLKAGPATSFVASDDDADLQQLLSWLLQSEQFPLQAESRTVDTTRLKLQGSMPQLVRQLKQHGWKFAPSGLTAMRGPYRLHLKSVGKSLRLTLSRIPR
ncbi:MAG: filamentous hemagglutinin N-terminal domain-containing protein [Candidatus Eremiobacteraeota bacterium]|nr:filamentous hemagglutinin N-terminal domain-containing protein [Candidatus Eremiobacteraeota bacterium]